jgi:DNA-binding transcriptional ArsR family regulator
MATDVPSALLDMETLTRVAPVIRNAAHPLRLRILDYLQSQGDARTVTEITDAAGVGQAVVSQQLRILKDQGILSSRREGNHVLYDISNPNVLLLLECIRRHGNCG